MGTKMSQRSIRLLKLLTSVTAIGSLFSQSVALFTNEWLYSEELMSNPEFKKYDMSAAPEHLSKFTTSGLWILCQNEPGIKDMNCSHIDYLTDEEYTPDPNDSTMAIPYAAKRAAVFMLISTGTILLGTFLCLTANQCKRRKVFTFASGISFILAGLLILCAIVIYISTFKAEVGNKLRPKSSFQEATFRYHYGISFMFAVVSLMMCEVAGTFSIFLYIRLHQTEWEKKFSQQEALVDLLQAPGPLPPHLDVLPPPIASYCKKHGGRGRRYSRSKEISREPSPIPLPMKTSRTPSYVGNLISPGLVGGSGSSDDHHHFRDPYQSTSFPFPPPPPPPLSSSVHHLNSSGLEDGGNSKGDPSSSHHAYSRHQHHCEIATVSTSVEFARETSRDYSPQHDSIYRTVYPPPILEQDFSSNSEYMGDYSPSKEFPLDTLRRTTPV